MNKRKFVILKMGEVPEIPKNFRCPICSERLRMEIDEWTTDWDGWKASDAGVHVTCKSEPDITDDNFGEWLDGHYQHPYIDWLPVDQAVYEWLEDNYRFTER